MVEDLLIFQAHSVRGASTSKAALSGVTVADILSIADIRRELPTVLSIDLNPIPVQVLGERVCHRTKLQTYMLILRLIYPKYNNRMAQGMHAIRNYMRKVKLRYQHVPSPIFNTPPPPPPPLNILIFSLSFVAVYTCRVFFLRSLEGLSSKCRMKTAHLGFYRLDYVIINPWRACAARVTVVINPWRACTARVTVVGSVCLSVCPCYNSPLDCLFVPQTIRSTERLTTITLIEPFFLNMLRCRDLSPASIVRIQTVGIFTLRMHIISATWHFFPLERRWSEVP